MQVKYRDLEVCNQSGMLHLNTDDPYFCGQSLWEGMGVSDYPGDPGHSGMFFFLILGSLDTWIAHCDTVWTT